LASGRCNEVAEANGIKTPKVYIADAPFPNAFAYGSPIAGKRVAITTPLLKILNKDEVKAVLGHELGHLRHRDVEFLMFIGLIPALIYWLGYSLWFSGLWGSWWGEGAWIRFTGSVDANRLRITGRKLPV
jgi:Heat shock protein. Metallo peptidase. MEROPS family M48B